MRGAGSAARMSMDTPPGQRPARFRRLALVALAAWLTACGAPPPAAEPLRASLSAEPRSLNFITENDTNTMQIAKLVCDTLVDYDRDFRLVPRLAESWQVSDDAREVTFHLRHDVVWHDGRPFTSADVAFTLDRVLDPATLAAGKRVYFETVVAHDEPDDFTIRVRRREPYARLVEVWQWLPILPRHRFEGHDFLDSPEHRAPIGTGPYRFLAWRSGERLELGVNERYFGIHPAIARLAFRPMPDPATRVEALLSGDLDLTGLRPADRARIEADPGLAARVRLLSQDILYVWYIAWNGDGTNPFFTDRRVRLAMTEALDRQGFVDHVLMGSGRVATSLVHPAMWAFNEAIAPWPYDRDGAARLLDEAGWRDHDGDGVRDRGGRRFAFALLVPAGNQEVERLAVLLQESLRTLGILLELKPLEYNVYRKLRDERQFEALIGGWSLDPDPDCYDFWHSSQRGRSGLNYSGYADPEVDRLCEEGRRIADRDRRAALYRRVQEILHRDQPETFVAYRPSIVGMTRRLRGVQTSALGLWGWYPGPLLWSLDSRAPAAER
jgi:peptide/nickel transport system substrate-binding protein